MCANVAYCAPRCKQKTENIENNSLGPHSNLAIGKSNIFWQVQRWSLFLSWSRRTRSVKPIRKIAHIFVQHAVAAMNKRARRWKKPIFTLIPDFAARIGSVERRVGRVRVCGVRVFACQYAGDAAATSPAVPKGTWLRPRPARQSRDCRRGRVHCHASLLRRLARLKAAASPAQHIRSALSQGMAGGAAHVAPCGPFGRFASLAATLRFAPAHFRLRRIPAGRRVRMRRGLPSPGSVGIPPVAGSAASRLPPSASPAVTASASCRRPSSPLRTFMARDE